MGGFWSWDRIWGRGGFGAERATRAGGEGEVTSSTSEVEDGSERAEMSRHGV